MADHHVTPYILMKLLIVGDYGAGKSSLLLRYSDDAFTSSFIGSISIDFKIKSIELDGQNIKLQIWDPAGADRFRIISTVSTVFYRGTMGIIVVYDVTDEESFNKLGQWMIALEQHATQEVNKILVGAKCDMGVGKQVDTARAQRFADEYGMQLFEASAKDNINVTEAFTHIVKEVKRRLFDSDAPIVDASAHIDLDSNDDKPKHGCF